MKNEMTSLTIDPYDEPEWASGYFRAFNKWKTTTAPKVLPSGYRLWTDLFCDLNAISRVAIESCKNAEETRKMYIKFTWNSEAEKLLFLLKICR